MFRKSARLATSPAKRSQAADGVEPGPGDRDQGIGVRKGARLLPRSAVRGPGHEAVEQQAGRRLTGLAMTSVRYLRLDTAELCRLDQRTDAGPVFHALVMSGERRFPAIEDERTDAPPPSPDARRLPRRDRGRTGVDEPARLAIAAFDRRRESIAQCFPIANRSLVSVRARTRASVFAHSWTS